MASSIDWRTVLADPNGAPRYEQIAAAFEGEIAAGRLRAGARLPAVRQLSSELGVSGATVAAAYELLNRRGWTRGEVGRGTFVLGSPANGAGSVRATPEPALAAPTTLPARIRSAGPHPWRQHALSASALRLRKLYPAAADGTTGRPDPALLPLEVLRRAWHEAIEALRADDLQYSSPEPDGMLVRQLLPRLERDGVPASPHDLVVGASALELMVLALDARSRAARSQVAVEEPGYSRAFDALERAGHRLVGIEIDRRGALPASLEAALAGGASAVLLTPRAHNPTGVSWTVERRAALADVLAAFPEVLVVEDDHFAELAAARPGSLLSDLRLEERVVHLRSFGKSIAPDLRLTVAVARPRLRAALAEAEALTAGWSSRLAQRVLATALADEALELALEAARERYAARRETAAGAITATLAPAGGAYSSPDGLNVWVQLPFGADASEVVERAAALGVLAAPGEPYFTRPGHTDVVRLTAGALPDDQAAALGTALGQAAIEAGRGPAGGMSV